MHREPKRMRRKVTNICCDFFNLKNNHLKHSWSISNKFKGPVLRTPTGKPWGPKQIFWKLGT